MSEPFESQAEFGSGDWIDKLGIPRDKRFSRPKLPHPENGSVQTWRRTSTIAKVLDDTFNLEFWKQRMTAKGVASRRDLTNRAATTDITDRPSWIEICEMAMEHAGGSEGRNNGTALHDLTEIYDKDPAVFDPAAYPEELVTDLYAYVAGLKAANITVAPDLMERTMINVEAGIAGTWDRVCYSPAWPFPRIADLKTQKTIDYSQASIAIQVAGYAYGSVMLPKPWNGLDGTREDYLAMPPLDLRTGILIHVPVGQATCTIYEIDLEEGYKALKTAASVFRWRSRKDLFVALPTGDVKPVTVAPRARKAAKKAQPRVTVPTARHTPATPYKEHVVEPVITVDIDQLAGVAQDDDKMRDHIRNAIRLIQGKDAKGSLQALYTMHKDLWTDDMTDLGKDRLRELAGLQPLGPPF